MKREFLKGFDLDKEVIDAIMSENGNDIEKAKADAESLKTEIDSLKEQLKERNDQINDLKKSADASEELKKQIEEMQNENKEKEKQHTAELKKLKIDSAIDSALKDAKNITAVKALLKDVDKFDFAEDGTIKGLSEQIATLKKTDSYLFHDGKPVIKGAKVGEPSDPEPTGVTQKQFNRMGYRDRVKLQMENPELYESLVHG